ncbi:hypothetical protein S7S_11410 [Isoalcanivorax pacificus W11-5]|uniref:Uncharacterized protein n=1 Tax=Isoalcanivorax pacificus W11-5 TaxID=391936 RepID=A0A0B4XK91_9GAMM|nr:hypothetical protein [Isoalcanivorax pacificus]AJD48694.1 hypothetical protein S7S_11410 [Isoalcanivorax pacificus W11-5]
MKPTNEHHEQPMQAGAPTPSLSPHLMAVWGAFLHEGLMLNAKNGGRASAILELWGQGCVELIMAVCEFIPDIWKQVQPYWYGPQDFPGVFEYEVVSILGEQLGNYILKRDGDLPSQAEAERMITALVVTFFSQGDIVVKEDDPEIPTERLVNLHQRFRERLDQLAGGEA